jgi:hypothetical protein
MKNLENKLEFIIFFNLLNYELKYVENENEFYVKKGDDWILKKFSVKSCGYLQTAFRFEKNKRTFILKHRLVFFAYNENFEIFRRSTTENFIDHVNGNPSNNRIENLRLVTHQQNQFNRKRARGYSWHKQNKKWRAAIRINGKKKHLGYFESEQDAREAYLKAKEIYHLFT